MRYSSLLKESGATIAEAWGFRKAEPQTRETEAKERK
jgi:hypothetical protein